MNNVGALGRINAATIQIKSDNINYFSQDSKSNIIITTTISVKSFTYVSAVCLDTIFWIVLLCAKIMTMFDIIRIDINLM